MSSGGKPGNGHCPSAKPPRRRNRLPVLGQAESIPERRDAAENRRRILEAARDLLKTRPIQDICMDELARTAGVGKGTLYRRFADRASLCRALLGDEALRIQEAVLQDFELPPGAPWVMRVEHLLSALLDFTIDHGSLLSEARAFERHGPEGYAHPAHTWQREALARYLSHAIQAREISPLDPILTAEFVLAALDPDLWAFHLREGRTRTELHHAFQQFARRATGGPSKNDEPPIRRG